MLHLLQVDEKVIFEWKKVLFGDQEMIFVFEVLFRTLVMYLVILIGLRLIGKRGVRQLSVFELVVIIGLGSAAGDPMFYQEVGLVSGIVVFAMIIGAYRLTTYLTGKYKTVEKLIEGEPVCLIEDGKFHYHAFDREDLAQDEFFAELRSKSVSQIGQVEKGYLETSGEVSLFFYPDEEVKAGLPILPQEFGQKLETITEEGIYACTSCGETIFERIGKHTCPVCENKLWVKASNRKRIA